MSTLIQFAWTGALVAILAAPASAEPETGEEADDSALGQCYRLARGSGDAPRPCDMAVEAARQSGDPQALVSALANRSLVLAASGQLDAALADVDTALEIAPDRAALHGNRGNLLLRLGRPRDALAAHGRAVRLAPKSPLGYFNRAFSHRAVGAMERAEQDLARARALTRGEVPEPLRAGETPVPAADPGR
ncbi:MAG: tetratricopeptide repeat protein [Pseudomonadota bacterium]